MNKILIFTSDESSCEIIKDALKDSSVISCYPDISKIIEQLSQKSFDLVIIDNDSEGINSIEVFKSIKAIVPRVRCVMMSRSTNISDAVTASKIGVLDYLSKPLNKEKVSEVVDKIIKDKRSRPVLSRPAKNSEWLDGSSSRLLELILRLEEVVSQDKDIMLVGECGVPNKYIAKLIHDNGMNKKRKFVHLHLSSFSNESSEAMFWTAIQELLSDRTSDHAVPDDICGTLYLESFDSLSTHFQKSIIKYLKNRSSEKVDRTIRIILGVNGDADLSKSGEESDLGYFLRVDIPPLRQRMEDLPLITNSYVRSFSGKYGKNIQGISIEAIDLFMLYDWPGNYDELRCMLESAALKCDGGMMNVTDFPIDIKMLLSASLKNALLKSDCSLGSAQALFMRNLVSLTMKFCKGDEEAAAKFLDIPKTEISDRIKNSSF